MVRRRETKKRELLRVMRAEFGARYSQMFVPPADLALQCQLLLSNVRAGFIGSLWPRISLGKGEQGHRWASGG